MAVTATLTRMASSLASSLATPLVPSDYLDLFAPLRSDTLRARVVEVRPETRDAVTLVLKPGRDWQGHTAGQWIRLGVDVQGVRLWRAYSLTSPPRPDGLITVTVKSLPDGVVSGHITSRVQPGDVLHLDQAAGDFVLPATRPAKALFVTAGSGITPVMGMLRAALDELPDVVLVHSAPTADDVVFGEELRGLAAAGRIRLVELHTDTDGMLTTDRLAELVPDLADRETWACGPVGMLDAIEAEWDRRGIVEQLHVERFRPSVVVAGDGGTVSFGRTGAGSDTVVEADGATPLLDVGEAAGVLMPSGCRMGICFGCVLPLREGAVRDLRTGETTTAGDGVLVQTCVSAAAGACRLEA
ncbi:MAG: ferredoxin reductase [Mycobacteriales bacterium]|nr:ferredoxin reductase [Mycobacteriales bacterium]